MSRLLLILAMAGCTIAQPAHADGLQDKLAAAALATQTSHFRFHRTSVIEQTGDDRRTIVEQYDPSRPSDTRWMLVSVDGRAPTAKDLQNARKAKRGPVASYANIAKWIAAPATRSQSAPGYVTYRFLTLPKGTLQIGSHDASSETEAEVTVNVKGPQPFVEKVRMRSNTGFRLMLVASVKSVEAISSFRQLGDGTVILDNSSSAFSGSMLGKSGEMRTLTRFSDYQPTR